MTSLVGSNSPLNLAVAKSNGRGQASETGGDESFLSVVGKLDEKGDHRKSRDSAPDTAKDEPPLDDGSRERTASVAAKSGQDKPEMPVSFDMRVRASDSGSSKTRETGAEGDQRGEQQARNLADILDGLTQLPRSDEPAASTQPDTEVPKDTATSQTPTRSIDIVIANLVSSGVSLATLVQVARASSGDGVGQRFSTVDQDATRSFGNDGTDVKSGDADDLFRFARTKDDAGLMERAGRGPASGSDASKATANLPSTERPAPLLVSEAGKPTPPVLEARTAADRSLELPGSGRLQAELSILESRKYLGVATGQTAVAAVVNAVTENPEWNAMLRETASTSATILNAAKNGSNSLKIQLSPAELGMVTATFRLTGGQLSVELKVETIEAYRQLSDDNSDIVKALKGHGYDIDHVSVQHVSNDRANVAPGQNQLGSSTSGGSQGSLPEGRSSGQQHERGSGSSAQSGGGGDGSSASSGGGDGGQRPDGQRADGRRPGSVYL